MTIQTIHQYRRSSIPIGDVDSVNDDGISTLSLEETALEMAEDTNFSPPSFFITDEKHLQNEQEVVEKYYNSK